MSIKTQDCSIKPIICSGLQNEFCISFGCVKISNIRGLQCNHYFLNEISHYYILFLSHSFGRITTRIACGLMITEKLKMNGG